MPYKVAQTHDYYSMPKNISRLCNSKFGHIILQNVQKEVSLLSIMPLLNGIIPKIHAKKYQPA